MENASKALIIAGAILLSILIIAIGMYIYNSSQGAIDGAGKQISAQELDTFNRQWEMYEGKQTGANVKSLVSKLSANAISVDPDFASIPVVAGDTDIARPTDSDGVQEYVNSCATFKSGIQTRATYTVTLTVNNQS